MSGATLPRQFMQADWKRRDPGTGNALPHSRGRVAIDIVTGASGETNSLPRPVKPFQELLLYCKTHGGGNRVITPVGGYDEAGGTTLTFTAAGQYVLLVSVQDSATTYAWRVAAYDGVTGPTTALGSLTVASSLTVGGVIVDPNKTVEVNCVLNSACVDQAFFTADRAYQVVGVTEIHAVAGDNGGAVNLQLTKDTGTDAPGAGTDLLTNNTNAGFNLKGTANTLQTGTLTATTASLQLAAGDRLSLDFAGTVTTLAGVQVTVKLKAI